MSRRSVPVVIAAVLVAATAVSVWFAVASKPRASGGPTQVPTATAPVTRGTVTQRVRIPGTYGYDGQYAIVHQGVPGILTGTAAIGATVDRGGVLYRVDNHAVRLLFGGTPAYRDLRLGMTDGPDVRELEQNLVDLHLDPAGQITVDDHFTAATDAAIRRWQVANGDLRTGVITLGQVAFAPQALRVSRLDAPVGTAVGPNGPVLTATSTARVVTADVGVDRQGLVKVGDEVIVSPPTGAPMTGTILRVSAVATVAQQSGNGQGGPATVTIVVGVTPPPGTPDLDQAPMLVAIATNVRSNVLLVPVTALLARPGGGYQVRLASGALVEVTPGLFDEATGKVEVTGRLNVGDLVEVPVP
jgi:peptidoglycan hydrolase-like protein with peptidoglycan-binding domain